MTATAFPPTGYTFHLSCLEDGGPLDLTPSTQHDADHVAAVVSCRECGRVYDVDVRMLLRPPSKSRIARVLDRIDAAAESAVIAGNPL